MKISKILGKKGEKDGGWLPWSSKAKKSDSDELFLAKSPRENVVKKIETNGDLLGILVVESNGGEIYNL